MTTLCFLIPIYIDKIDVIGFIHTVVPCALLLFAVSLPFSKQVKAINKVKQIRVILKVLL